MAAGGPRRAAQREARRLALAAVFEGEFGRHTAAAALERTLAEEAFAPPAAELARQIVTAVVDHAPTIDEAIAEAAPAYPVAGLARIDRALLRCALGEVLHCPATPLRVAIAEWVELARTYSGEPARRLVNGVLGRIAGTAASQPETGSDIHRTRQGRNARPRGGST